MVIFLGETALYPHGLIDGEYSEICVTVPTGYNATHFKAGNVQIKYASKSSYGLGKRQKIVPTDRICGEAREEG